MLRACRQPLQSQRRGLRFRPRLVFGSSRASASQHWQQGVSLPAGERKLHEHADAPPHTGAGGPKSGITMNWMRQHTRGAKPPGYAKSVLSRYRLGIKAGGAIAGVRMVPAPDSCPVCMALGGTIYDPDSAPEIPVTNCAHLIGCRCAYAAVMAYEMIGWQVDHRPK